MKRTGIRKRIALYAAAAALLIMLAAISLACAAKRDGGAGTADAVRDAVRRSAMQCYVIEGAYPVSLEYLQDNYGLAVNTEDYKVIYIAYAENIPPEIKVVPEG